MQVGAAGSANNPLASVVWVAGLVVKKTGSDKPVAARKTHDLSDEELVEKHLDRVTLYGSIDLTRDKEVLAHAQEMKKIIDAVVKTLEV